VSIQLLIDRLFERHPPLVLCVRRRRPQLRTKEALAFAALQFALVGLAADLQVRETPLFVVSIVGDIVELIA
jgi:hypothetical protein